MNSSQTGKMMDQHPTQAIKRFSRTGAIRAALAAMLAVGLGGGLGGGLAGCSSDGTHTPTRDFNELIPRIMGQVNSKSPTQAAAALFDTTNPDERRDAIAYLETRPWGHEPPYMKAYEILTTDPSPMVRSQAMRALGSSHDPAAVPYLVNGTTGKTGLADPEAEVRRDAAQGLVDTYGPSAAPALQKAVRSDPDDQVRINAAKALAHSTGQRESIRALIDALDDSDPAVVYFAHDSLVKLTHQNISPDSKAWLSWYQSQQAATKPAGQG